MDGLSDKSTSREPGLDSKHQHNSSQPSTTPVRGGLTPSSDLCRNQACSCCTHPHVGKTPIYRDEKISSSTTTTGLWKDAWWTALFAAPDGSPGRVEQSGMPLQAPNGTCQGRCLIDISYTGRHPQGREHTKKMKCFTRSMLGTEPSPNHRQPECIPLQIFWAEARTLPSTFLYKVCDLN